MTFFRRPLASILALGLLFAPLVPASAQTEGQPVKLLRDRPANERPQLMLLGTPHLANHGRDVLNNDVPDVLEPNRQQEIAAVVDALVKFKPTKVVIEWAIDGQAKIDERYNAFKAGNYTLSRSEIDQFAMRVAAKLGHDRIYAVDWNKMPPGTIEDFDWAQWAERNGHQARVSAMRDPSGTKQTDAFMRSTPVASWLVHRNRPEELEKSHRRYFDYAMLSDSVNYPGPNWLGNWYARNFKIFANIVRLADKPEDRILVVYGAGHIYLLRQFAEQSGAFSLVSPLSVLPASR